MGQVKDSPAAERTVEQTETSVSSVAEVEQTVALHTFEAKVREWTTPSTLLEDLREQLPEGTSLEIEAKPEHLPEDALDILGKLDRAEPVSARELRSASASLEQAKRRFERTKQAEILDALSGRVAPPAASERKERPEVKGNPVPTLVNVVTVPFQTPRPNPGSDEGSATLSPDLDMLKRENHETKVAVRDLQAQIAAPTEVMTGLVGVIRETRIKETAPYKRPAVDCTAADRDEESGLSSVGPEISSSSALLGRLANLAVPSATAASSPRSGKCSWTRTRSAAGRQGTQWPSATRC